MEMTRLDVKNYLEKIYKIPVLGVRIHVAPGEYKKSSKGYIVKEEDYKLAYVDLVCKFFVLMGLNLILCIIL